MRHANMVKLYDTLTREIEEFKAIEDGVVKLYTCGPTVYGYYHIGNLRNAVFNDTLRRMFEANGYGVKHVINITDVGHLTGDVDEGEDKLEKGAKNEGKSVWEVAQHYAEAFKNDVSEINVLPPNGYKGKSDNYARATDFINEQIEIVKILLGKDFAYKTEQAIYFDTTKLDSYGELTGQKISDKEVAARSEVVTDTNKRNPQDFAVWFFTVGHFSGHSMHWPSPWGDGFPGWHLECSAIIHATLTDPIDVHTGGVDLIGTHHTNEIAQTQAAFSHKLANYWVHNEFVVVDNHKMSKSLGNIYTLADIKQKGYSPIALRLLFLQAHYRGQLNFTWESLDAAQRFLNRLHGFADLKFQPELGHKPAVGQTYSPAIQSMKEAISDDLNTSGALAVLSGLVSAAEANGQDASLIQHILEDIDRLLGLNMSKRKDITDEQKAMIAAREVSRKAGDWTKADELRGKLLQESIEINDTSHGPVWSRTKQLKTF